jgi:hypothetical protein
MTLDPFYRFRSSLADALERDLVGPLPTDTADDDELLLVEAPITRYLSGILFPQSSDAIDQENDLDASDDYDETSAPDPPVAMANVKYPSSMGLTFAVSDECQSISVQVTAARYAPEEAEESPVEQEGLNRRKRFSATTRRWRRTALSGEPVIIDTRAVTGDARAEVFPGLEIFWRTRSPRHGSALITVGLINTIKLPIGTFDRDEHCFFQPRLTVTGVDHPTPFVARLRDDAHADDEDLRSYQLLYRHSIEFATGHGCSVDWTVSDKELSRCAEIRMQHLPRFELKIADSNPAIVSEWFGMIRLAEAPRANVVSGLGAFCDDYRMWIEARRQEANDLDDELRATGWQHLSLCDEVHQRMLRGTRLLADDDQAWDAFVLTNRAMAEQRARSEALLAGDDPSSDLDLAVHQWRPFQLGFILLALAGIADPSDPERELVDLLWFPTGGGKTEAYLGLIAFTTFLRRLRAPTVGGGVTVLMRYTLRLLTIQQFERAALLICVCEHLRKQASDRLGSSPVSIGLWIGRDGAPNTRRGARKSLDKLRTGAVLEKENPVQLHRCPWCGLRLDYRNYWIRNNDPRMMITCRNDACEFKHGLPVFIVDEDIYDERPTLLIATADKYAGLPWQEKTTELFNVGCPEQPPELIIQDELHLISGPLGTLAGLYETAIDLLCRGTNGAPPKVIASTATIRRARTQVLALFSRDVRQFPPPALDARDSWFAIERPRNERGTRLYVGLIAPATSQTTLLVRTYGLLLQVVSELSAEPEHRDPYWTLLGYFNSLRVLGSARMQVQDDVPGYMAVIAGRDKSTVRPVDEIIELTSREPSSSIPGHLKSMESPYGSDGALDLILATNMISVGVDIGRLGLMAVMGQPQSASEYIQATSRVGRRYPGLVAIIFNSSRSRDRSHYESFVAFHSALYRQVDASSVTPFSPRARDRGLHAVLVALTRLTVPELRANKTAGNSDALERSLPSIRDLITRRVHEVAPEQEAATKQHLDDLIAQWLHRARTESDLRYVNPDNPDGALLVEATESDPDMGQFPTLRSLRDVDTESNLYLVRP